MLAVGPPLTPASIMCAKVEVSGAVLVVTLVNKGRGQERPASSAMVTSAAAQNNQVLTVTVPESSAKGKECQEITAVTCSRHCISWAQTLP